MLLSRPTLSEKRNFWFTGTGPIIVFFAGITFARPTDSYWVFSDLFCIFWIVLSGLSVHFWRRVFSQHRMTRVLVLIPVFSAMMATLECSSVYLLPTAGVGSPGRPWMMAELGFRWARARMGAAEGFVFRFGSQDRRMPHLVEALRWYRLSTEPGCPLPAGIWDLLSLDNFSDIAEKRELLKVAAELAEPLAAWMLAQSYEYEFPQDQTKAQIWRLTAAELGFLGELRKTSCSQNFQR